ncbi:MAG TPA: CPBP family intramembrane glutamic endopeptidase [Balneolales bacterium]|nr:CPBP family intramembrane glutamic endopeptidase [Balneolales bacterium]
MKLLKNDAGDVRLLWKVLLLVVGFFAVTYLLEEFFIWIAKYGVIRTGVMGSEATEQAHQFVSEFPPAGDLFAIAESLIWLLIGWVLVSKVEKQSFKSQLIGFEWKKNSIMMILIGIVIATLFVVLSIVMNVVFWGGTFDLLKVQVSGTFGGILLTFVAALVLAFTQELIFRSYLQDRMIDKFGVGVGIMLTSILFVVCNVIFRTMPAIELLSGIFLYILIGYLYYRLRSLYLVGSIHTMIILYPALFGIEAPGEERFVIAILLMMVGFYYFNEKDQKEKSAESIEGHHRAHPAH